MYQRRSQSTRQGASRTSYRDIYVFICEHYHRHGSMPSVNEIAMRLGVQKTYLVRFKAFVKAMGVEVATLAAGRVRIPWPVESLRDMLEASDLYACQTGRRPSFPQLADALDMTEDQLRRIAPRKLFMAQSKTAAERRKGPHARSVRLPGFHGIVVQEPERILVYFRDGHLLRKQPLPLGASFAFLEDQFALESVRQGESRIGQARELGGTA